MNPIDRRDMMKGMAALAAATVLPACAQAEGENPLPKQPARLALATRSRQKAWPPKKRWLLFLTPIPNVRY